MRKLVVMLALGVMTASAFAQPYNARGTFNSWGETAMNDDGDGTYSVTINGLTPGNIEKFKVAQNDWAFNVPSQNMQAMVGPAGTLEIHFLPGAHADGWNPGADRVGYSDTGATAWELSGEFNGWATGDPASAMTDLGNGLHSVDYTIATPGTYQFKFKSALTWDVAIGADGQFGGEGGANAEVTTSNPNETLRFQIDLPNGRWRAAVVPEPATLALLALGGALVIRRRIG